MLEDSSEVMIGPSRRRNAFRLGIVLLALSALVSVVARAKLVVGRGTPFPGGTRTRRTLDSRLLNEKLDSGHPERGGFARTEIIDCLSSGLFSREELGRNSAV